MKLQVTLLGGFRALVRPSLSGDVTITQTSWISPGGNLILAPKDLFKGEWLSNSMTAASGPSGARPTFKTLFSVLYMGTSGQRWAAKAPQSQSHYLPSPSQL